MPINLNPQNINGVIDWTDEVNLVPNQYGFIKNQGLFDVRPTTQTSIIFDRNIATTTLLPQVNRGSRNDTVGKERKVDTFAMPLSFFKHSEFIVPEDIQGIRDSGTPTGVETLANVRAEKFEDGRRAVDQTQEYMQIQAVKGISTTPDGTVLANMFDLFDVTQETINFDFSAATTNIYQVISTIKRSVQANLQTGGVVQGIDVMCSDEFFDALVAHPWVRETYLNSQSNSALRDSMSSYFNWGVSDVFEYNGVRFFTYPAVFVLPDGTTETAVAEGEAHVIPRVRGLFRGFYGPSDKLTGANQPGRELFAFEYRDIKDENHEIQFQTAPLYFSTRPRVLIKLTGTYPS